MGWVAINNHLDDRYGYYHGVGVDSGLFVFPRGGDDWDADSLIMSYHFDCTLSGYGGFYEVAPYTYNEHPVFRNETKSQYCFYSIRNKWILFERLQEPISYLDIDLSTYLGDGWYELQNAPNFSRNNFTTPIDLTPKGVYANNSGEEEEEPTTTQLINSYSCYEFNYSDYQSEPYGRYINSSTGEVRMFGTPIWRTSSADRSMRNLNVKCLSADANGATYSVGSSHTLQYDDSISAWTIDTPNSGRWWEGESKPSIDSSKRYECYEMQEGEKTNITSAYVDITFYTTEQGERKGTVLMGEVAEWH